MATLEQPEIHVTEPEPLSPVPTEDTILRWVAKVDDYIDSESLNILKLSAQNELTQGEYDGVKTASDLYHALAKHYIKPEILLARFIYALEKLGHRRYGHRAVRELPNSGSLAPFDLAKLKPSEAGEAEFILRQRLAVLCCMLPGDYNTSFIAYFAKKLKTNPNKYNTPCEVLTKSLMLCIINTDNQFNEIEEALIKVELPESQIKEYFDNYEKIATFERLRTSSFSPSKTSNSSDSSPNQGKKFIESDKTSRKTPDSSDFSDNSGGPSPVPRSTDSTSSTSSGHRDVKFRGPPTATENTPLLQHHGPGQDQNDDGGTLPQANIDIRPGITKKTKRYKIWCGCAIFLILLVLLAVGAAVLIGFAVKQYKSNQPMTERYRENSSVVLTELNHFYTESLTVIEDTEHLNDYRHDIDVYHAEGKCSNLVNTTTYTINGSDFSSIPTVYALAGSFISVHICGSTNAIIDSERLEIVLSNHLEESNFDRTPYKVNFFHPGLNGKQKCKNVTFDLSANGFYTLSLVHPSIPISFEGFKLTYKILAVDYNLLAEHAIANYTLRADLESYKFTMSRGVRQSCFVAVIRGNPHTSKGDVHIQLKYNNRMDGLIAGVVLCATVVLALVILAILAALTIKHTKTE